MEDADAPVAHVSLEQALAKLPGPSGERSVPLFRHGTLLVKLYAPQSHDPQTPHSRDEAYVVAQGHGLFFDGVTRRPFGPAEAAGAALMGRPGEQPWGYSGQFKDPDGHVWEIMWNPRFEVNA